MRRLLHRATHWFEEARRRARRRKSPWNLLLIPLGFAGWLGTWYILFRLVWALHLVLYPDDSLDVFRQKGLGFGIFLQLFLIAFSPAIGALGTGMMLANFTIWIIPPARRALDAEAVGHPGASFSEAMKVLAKFTGWILPPGVVIALIAACLGSLP